MYFIIYFLIQKTSRKVKHAGFHGAKSGEAVEMVNILNEFTRVRASQLVPDSVHKTTYGPQEFTQKIAKMFTLNPRHTKKCVWLIHI